MHRRIWDLAAGCRPAPAVVFHSHRHRHPQRHRIKIATVVAAERTGGVPVYWTEHALRNGKRGIPLKAHAPRPELAVWVARRYLRNAAIDPTGG